MTKPPTNTAARREAIKVKTRNGKRPAVDRLKARVAAMLKRRKRVGGKPAQRAVSTEMSRIVDAFEALDLKRQGLSWRQIGDRLGCSFIHARELVYEAAAEVDGATPDLVTKWRAIEGERLEESRRVLVPLIHGALPKQQVPVQTGEGKDRRTVLTPVPNDPIEVAKVQNSAIRTDLHRGTRMAALYGLDAPIKIAPTDPGGQRRYHDLSDEELDRLLAQKAAMLGVKVIDVTPGRNGDRKAGL